LGFSNREQGTPGFRRVGARWSRERTAWCDSVPPSRRALIHKGNPTISWHVGVTGLYGLHWTPFQALRACWHACLTCQPNVPVFHPITEGRFHHSRTSRGSPDRPCHAMQTQQRHSFDVTNRRKSATKRAPAKICDDEQTCAARSACNLAASESGPRRCCSTDVAAPQPRTSPASHVEDTSWG